MYMSTDDFKIEVIDELLHMMKDLSLLVDYDEALNDVMAREGYLSTGLERGLAIPHAKTDIVEGLIAAVGIKKEGIDFESLDGQPATIFIMTLSPAQRAGPHIQFLAEISRLLNDAAIRDKVLNAKSKEEVLDILSSDYVPGSLLMAALALADVPAIGGLAGRPPGR